MFNRTETWLSASNAALISSESFLIPMTLAAEGKSLEVALGALKAAHAEALRFITQLAALAPGLVPIEFNESISPTFSRIDLQLENKDRRVDLTFAVRCPFTPEQDYWARLNLMSRVCDRFADLAVQFKDRNKVSLFMEKARLSHQKDDDANDRFRHRKI